MSFPSTIDSVYANQIQLTSQSGTDVDIVCTTGNVLINGVLPSNGGGGGGGILPPNVNGTGDLTTQGNIRAQGDGVSTGKLEGEIVKATSGNIIASLGDIVATAGNITAQGNGVATGKITGMTLTATSGNITATSGDVKVLAGDVEIDGTGSLLVNGTGEIKTVGGGNITAGLNGDIQTTAGDIISAGDIYFEGNDIYKKYNDPPSTQSYLTYHQLVTLPGNNLFTGSNQFNANPTEFSQRLAVGTRTDVGIFTQNLALNPSGNVDCKTINNNTIIQCGNINCGNFSENSVRAKKFISRTTEHNSIEGWTIEQEVPVSGSPSPLDKILQIKGGEVGGSVTIVDNAHSGNVANISLDPRTTATGGKITTTQYNVGEGTTGYLITQPTVGVHSENLLIMSGSGANPKVVFDDYGSTTTLMTLEKETGTNDGLLSVPAIEFGVGALHNKIYQLQSGASSLNLNIKQATDSSEVVFQDNVDDEIIRIRKAAVELKANIEFHFGSYNFVPQQFYKDIFNFSYNHSLIGPTNLIFNTGAVGGNPVPTDWFNVNTNVGGQSTDILNNPGAYKIAIRQTSNGSQGEINGMFVMSDIVLSTPNDNAPDIELAQPTAYSYTSYDGNSPIITMVPGFLNWAVHCTFPQVSGNETSNIRITLTKMPFFA
jgi:hypothetical protein